MSFLAMLGYGVLLERACLLTVQAVGGILALSPALSRSLGVPEIGRAGFEAERAAFAFANMTAYVLGFAWWAWLTRAKTVKTKTV